MRRNLLVLVGLAICASDRLPQSAAAPKKDVYESPQQAAQDPDFKLQGEYVGKEVSIQVVAQGDGEFLAVVYRGGLPGAAVSRLHMPTRVGDCAAVHIGCSRFKLRSALVRSRASSRRVGAAALEAPRASVRDAWAAWWTRV